MEETTLKGMSIDDIQALPFKEQEKLLECLKILNDQTRYNRINEFTPYEFQKKFYKAGADHKIRYLRAANRVGKSYSAAAEVSYHITGKYPDWWEGDRIESSGGLFVCVGVDLDSTSRVMQKELLGSMDCRLKELLGTGAIPRDNIVFDRGWIPDGARLKQCQIKHIDGGLNTLLFMGSEYIDSIMGVSCVLAWCDEEGTRSIDLFSQIKTRLANARGIGNDGGLIWTSTPEKGLTPLNTMFDEDDSGYLYMQNATWWDAPHISAEQIEEWLATLPPYQRDMRSKGIPIIGTGAVYNFDFMNDVLPRVNLPSYSRIVAGIDWGVVADPTVIIIAAHDPVSDTYYLIDEFVFAESQEDRSPARIAQFLLSHPTYRNIPIIVPHDSGLGEGAASDAKGKMLQRFGLNVIPHTFVNPVQTKLSFKWDATTKKATSIQAGINEICLMMQEGRLKVAEHCEEWLKQVRGYFYKRHNVTGKITYAGADHSLDASRYALLTLMNGEGMDYAQLGEHYQPMTSHQAYSINF